MESKSVTKVLPDILHLAGFGFALLFHLQKQNILYPNRFLYQGLVLHRVLFETGTVCIVASTMFSLSSLLGVDIMQQGSTMMAFLVK